MCERVSPPATLVISRVMRSGGEAAYVPWVDRVIDLARRQAGWRSVVRLDQVGELHHLLITFDGTQTLDAWTRHADYAALAKEADAFSVGLEQREAGVVARFTVPSEASAKKWKTALVTWAGVVPTLLIVSSAIGWVLPDAPRVVQQLCSSMLLTSALTWLILPRVRARSRSWMMRGPDGNLRREAG